MDGREAEIAQEIGRTLATTSLTALLESIREIFDGDEHIRMRSAIMIVAFAYIEVYLEIVNDNLDGSAKQTHARLKDVMRGEQRAVFDQNFKQ